MNSRERILKTLNHEEPDRIPFDLGGTPWTGISIVAYQNFMRYLGLPLKRRSYSDVIQQLALPDEIFLKKLKIDTRGLFPLTSHNWDVFSKLNDAEKYWEYLDEWGIIHHFQKPFGFSFFNCSQCPGRCAFAKYNSDVECIDGIW